MDFLVGGGSVAREIRRYPRSGFLKPFDPHRDILNSGAAFDR
jgi:hypothetical protein